MEFTIKGSYNKRVIIYFWDHNEGSKCSKNRTINTSPRPLECFVQNFAYARPFENDSLCEIDNDPKEVGGGVQK